MSIYSYGNDSFLKFGNIWVRCSRIESVRSESANSTGHEQVIVTTFTGEKIRFTTKNGEAQRIIDLMAGVHK